MRDSLNRPSPTGWRSWLAAPLLGLAGYGLGLALVLVGSRGLAPTPHDWVNWRFFIFAVLFGFQVALWSVLAAPLLGPVLGTLRGRAGRARVGLLLAGGAPLLLMVVPFVAGQVFYRGEIVAPYDAAFPHHALRMGLASALGAAAVLPHFLLIRAISEAAVALPQADAALECEVEQLVHLRRELQTLIGSLGAIVAAVTVATDAQRRFINAAYAVTLAPDPLAVKPDDPRLAPQEATILYGLFFTLLLALVYVPAHARLTAAGRRIVGQASPLPDPTLPFEAKTVDSWGPAYARRKSLEELLELKAGPFESLRASIAVLAPFLGSVLGAGLPGK